MRKNGMYGGNMETISINDIYKVFVSICLVHDGQITQPPTIINITVSQIVTKRNVYSFVL
jgi:hypothetical protein